MHTLSLGVTLLDASIKLPVGFEQLFLAQCNTLFTLLILLPSLLHSDGQFKLHITSHCVGYYVGLATNHLNKGWLQQMNTRCAALYVYYHV